MVETLHRREKTSLHDDSGMCLHFGHRHWGGHPDEFSSLSRYHSAIWQQPGSHRDTHTHTEVLEWRLFFFHYRGYFRVTGRRDAKTLSRFTMKGLWFITVFFFFSHLKASSPGKSPRPLHPRWVLTRYFWHVEMNSKDSESQPSSLFAQLSN